MKNRFFGNRGSFSTLRKHAVKALLAMATVAAGGVAVPSQAEAYLIVTLHQKDMESVIKASLFCSFPLIFLTMPVCLFGEDASPGDMRETKQDLMANQYSAEEADLILNDRQRFIDQMNATGSRLVVTPDESRASLAAGIRQVDPDASDAFINFIADQAKLQ